MTGTAITINVAIEASFDAPNEAAERFFDRSTVGMVDILQQVVAERLSQDIKHGGPAHDDTHTPDDWADIMGDLIFWLTDTDDEPADYRDRLTKIAAVAVAAAQSWDRLHPRCRSRGGWDHGPSTWRMGRRRALRAPRAPGL